MDSLTVTIVGGIVVVVIGLFIEYGIFQRRKKNKEEGSSLDTNTQGKPQLTDNISEGLLDISGKTDADLPWPKAINKAVEEFHILHQGKEVDVISTNASGRHAYLLIMVWSSGSEYDDTYSLTVDKTGEILSIEKQPRW